MSIGEFPSCLNHQPSTSNIANWTEFYWQKQAKDLSLLFFNKKSAKKFDYVRYYLSVINNADANLIGAAFESNNDNHLKIKHFNNLTKTNFFFEVNVTIWSRVFSRKICIRKKEKVSRNVLIWSVPYLHNLYCHGKKAKRIPHYHFHRLAMNR